MKNDNIYKKNFVNGSLTIYLRSSENKNFNIVLLLKTLASNNEEE